MESKLEVSNLLGPLIKVFKSINAEWNNYFEIGLSEYLQSQTEKYYFTNTFIHRGEKVRFKDIYYPIKTTYKKLSTDFSNLDEIFDEYKNITLIGSAGSGKTTLLKHIFLKAIQNHTRIPILIELRNLNEYDGDFEKLVEEKIFKLKVKPDDSILKRTLASGNFLILLDGYDEIFSSKKQEINRQIEMFVDTYSSNKFLLTTRPGSGIESFPRFYDFRVTPLEDKDVEGFISKIVEEGERKERIIKIIKEPVNSNYVEYLRNPLLLSMFIMAFESHPEIPQRKSAFYRNVFDTLYSMHDGVTKNSFPREKLTKLQRDDFEYLLSVFSYITLIEGQYSFTQEYLADSLGKVKKITDYKFVIDNLIYDLRTSISILVLDGFEYYFPHRSMQEYFTALFISKLPTEKKERAYSNLSNILQKSSADYSFNLWNLCNELDESAFVSSFLIPQLKNIYRGLNGKEDRALVEAYFDLINPTIFSGDFKKKGEPELCIFREASFQHAVLDFCQIYNYMDFWNFPTISGCHDELSKIFNKILNDRAAKGDTRQEVDLRGNEEIINLFLNYKVTDFIKSIKERINSKVIQWDSDIERRKSNIDDLLGI